MDKQKEELYKSQMTWDDQEDQEYLASSPRRNRKKKRKKPQIILLRIVGVCLILCLVTGGVVSGLKLQGEKKIKETVSKEEIVLPQGNQEDDGEYVTYHGEKYRYNEDLITILFMGIDTKLQGTKMGMIGANGQADTLLLAVIDSKKGEISLINISRDSMVDVNEYNVEGQFLDTKRMQVCLAYAYGDGKEKSCLNTVDAVSRLMYGMPIHAYAAIDYSGIAVLNDAVGGVTVEVLEDLSMEDSQLTLGNIVTLSGEQAHTYVRSRNTELLDSNNLRMSRQRQYLQAFIQTTMEKMRKDITLPISIYQDLSDYSVTDLTASEVAYLAPLALESGVSENDMYSIAGEVVKGEEYAEFIPDEEELFELILDLFYDKVVE